MYAWFQLVQGRQGQCLNSVEQIRQVISWCLLFLYPAKCLCFSSSSMPILLWNPWPTIPGLDPQKAGENKLRGGKSMTVHSKEKGKKRDKRNWLSFSPWFYSLAIVSTVYHYHLNATNFIIHPHTTPRIFLWPTQNIGLWEESEKKDNKTLFLYD